MSKIKHFFRWIKKSIEYSIFLWNDQDWDYVYILLLLQYKLKRTRKCIVKNDLIEDAGKVSKQINATEETIDRLVEDDYFSEEWDKLGKDYPYSSFCTRKVLDNGMVAHEYNPPEEYRTRSKELLNKSDQLRERDWNLLFNSLKQHMRDWWD